jgi:hypothetical protein
MRRYDSLRGGVLSGAIGYGRLAGLDRRYIKGQKYTLLSRKETRFAFVSMVNTPTRT